MSTFFSALKIVKEYIAQRLLSSNSDPHRSDFQPGAMALWRERLSRRESVMWKLEI